MLCKSCEPEIVFVLICTLAEQFHIHQSYKTRESTLSCIGHIDENIDLAVATWERLPIVQFPINNVK